MALEGRHIRAIVAATGENRAVLSQWYNTARAAGHVIPYMVDVQFVKPVPIEPERPTAEVIDLPRPKRNYDRIQGRFLLMMDELTDSNRGGVNRGAELLGVDVEEYLRRRRSALALYTQGVSPAEVARTVGITVKQAQNWKSRAEEAGVLTRPPHAPPLRPRSATRTKRGKLMTYVTEVEEFSSPGSRATAERAAHRLGLTLAAYLDKRRDALAMFRRDATSPEVADTLGIDMHHVTNWRAYALGAGLLKPFRAKA
jgi:transposase